MFHSNQSKLFHSNRRFNMMRATTCVAGLVGFFAAGTVSAATITAADIAAAASGTTSGTDLGTTLVTIDDFTIESTAASRNLGGNSTAIGVVGGLGSNNTAVDSTEELTLGFGGSVVTIQSFTIGGHGKNDKTASIGGFLSDPGASVTGGLPAGWTITYDAGTDTVSIASNNNAGFLASYTVVFSNPVDVTSLTFTAPEVTDGGAAGVSFIDVTYIPEPGSLALIAIGGFCALRRRRG